MLYSLFYSALTTGDMLVFGLSVFFSSLGNRKKMPKNEFVFSKKCNNSKVNRAMSSNKYEFF